MTKAAKAAAAAADRCAGSYAGRGTHGPNGGGGRDEPGARREAVRDRDVGGGAEAIAFAFQPLLEQPEVFDHTVVHDGQQPIPADVRMCVLVGGRAVRGPSCMADARGSLHGQFGQHFFQAIDAAGGLADD